MYRKFHDRFGTAGVVIAVIALVVALGGTALAAGGLSGKQKKEVTKIAQKFAGKDGAAGAAGANGTNGANGKDGAAGSAGANGATGPIGATGPAGAKGSAGAKGATGPAGSAGLEGEPGEAGATGPAGVTGPAGPVTGEAQPGIEMQGVFEINRPAGEGSANAIVSFPMHLPSFSTPEGFEELEEVLEGLTVVPFPESFEVGKKTGCPGWIFSPRADPGKFCFYESPEWENLQKGGFSSNLPSTGGFLINVQAETGTTAEPGQGKGSWAVHLQP